MAGSLTNVCETYPVVPVFLSVRGSVTISIITLLAPSYAYRSMGILGHRAIHSKLRYLLVLDGQEHIYLRLAFLHACMISVHKLRGPHSHLATDSRQRYIQANFRDDVARCKRMKDELRSLRSSGF